MAYAEEQHNSETIREYILIPVLNDNAERDFRRFQPAGGVPIPREHPKPNDNA